MRPLAYASLGIGLVLALFAGRYALALHAEARDSLAQYAERTAVVVGQVVADPDKRSTSLRATVRVESINGQEAPHGKLLAVLPRETELAYGSRVELRGLIKLPESFETNTGRVFDYPGYLRVRGVSAVLERATLREQQSHATVFGALFEIKHAFEKALERSLPEPHVSLVEGMLLGERGGFDSALLNAFIIVGLIHIVVLSGSNIAIVSEGVFRLLGTTRLPKVWLYSLGFVAIVLFALMVGGGAATVRAVIMGSIAILARYLRRPEQAMRALVFATILMAFWNPLVVFNDTGFMLSVLATFGLITLAPFLESKLTMVPAHRRFNIRSIVATTIAVEIFILPALLYTSGVLSLVSLPVNIVVLPLVPLVMLAGFVTGVAGLVHPLVAFVPALIATVLLGALLAIVNFASSLPLASTVVLPFPWWVAVIAYVPLTYLALTLYTHKTKKLF